MLPESHFKLESYIQVSRISHSREQLVKTRTSLTNKIHSIFNSLKCKLNKEILTSKRGLDTLLDYELDTLTKLEISIFKQQIEQLSEGIKQMDSLLRRSRSETRWF